MSDSPNTISQVQCFFCFPFYLKNQECAMCCGHCFDKGCVPCPCCEYRHPRWLCIDLSFCPSCANLPAGQDQMHTGNDCGQQPACCCAVCNPCNVFGQCCLSWRVWMGEAQWGDKKQTCCFGLVGQAIISAVPKTAD